MPDKENANCRICNGPHETSAHFRWVEKSEGMSREEIAAELEKYGGPLKAMQAGGVNAAEKALKEIGLTMKGGACFCGTPNHSGADHLRWLADKESEL